MIDVYTYEGIYGNGSILIPPYLAVWSEGMLVGSSKPMGLYLFSDCCFVSLFRFHAPGIHMVSFFLCQN